MTSTNDITHPHFPEEEKQICNGYVITEGLRSLPGDTPLFVRGLLKGIPHLWVDPH